MTKNAKKTKKKKVKEELPPRETENSPAPASPQSYTVVKGDQSPLPLPAETALSPFRFQSEVLCLLSFLLSYSGGMIRTTEYVIPSRVEDNTSLFEMVENALDLMASTASTAAFLIVFNNPAASGNKLTPS